MEKNKLKKHKLWLVIIVTLFLLAAWSGCSQKDNSQRETDFFPEQETASPLTGDRELFADQKIISLLLPDKLFQPEENGFRDEEGKLWKIRQVIPGSFIEAGRAETLVIAEVMEGLSHAEGFYQAQAGVVSTDGTELLGTVKQFSADEGKIAVFKGEDKSYLFFAGNTTYNGWTIWLGGLWAPGQVWSSLWPESPDFWENSAVEIEKDRLKVLKRIIKPQPDQLIPDYEWEFAYNLVWDPHKSSFFKAGK